MQRIILGKNCPKREELLHETFGSNPFKCATKLNYMTYTCVRMYVHTCILKNTRCEHIIVTLNYNRLVRYRPITLTILGFCIISMRFPCRIVMSFSGSFWCCLFCVILLAISPQAHASAIITRVKSESWTWAHMFMRMKILWVMAARSRDTTHYTNDYQTSFFRKYFVSFKWKF